VWVVEYTDEFEIWWNDLTMEQQEALHERVALLSDQGPSLGRPVVEQVDASRHPNMKELRVSKAGALRVLFAFDPRRSAILLLGGDKTGAWDEWYDRFVPEADRLYDEHLEVLRQEGLLDFD